MSAQLYDLCCKYNGKVVRMHERNGRVHFGKIVNVTRSHVYIQPIERNNRRNLGGYGYGFWGPRYGGFYGYGSAYAVALGALTGVALAGLLFW